MIINRPAMLRNQLVSGTPKGEPTSQSKVGNGMAENRTLNPFRRSQEGEIK